MLSDDPHGSARLLQLVPGQAPGRVPKAPSMGRTMPRLPHRPPPSLMRTVEAAFSAWGRFPSAQPLHLLAAVCSQVHIVDAQLSSAGLDGRESEARGQLATGLRPGLGEVRPGARSPSLPPPCPRLAASLTGHRGPDLSLFPVPVVMSPAGKTGLRHLCLQASSRPHSCPPPSSPSPKLTLPQAHPPPRSPSPKITLPPDPQTPRPPPPLNRPLTQAWKCGCTVARPLSGQGRGH